MQTCVLPSAQGEAEGWILSCQDRWPHRHRDFSHKQNIKRGINIHCRVTLSIEAMLQHQAKCSQFLSVGEPSAIIHPCWICWALSPYHQKHRPTRPVEGFIYKVPLRGNNKVRDIQKVKKNKHISGVAVKWAKKALSFVTDACIMTHLSNCTRLDHTVKSNKRPYKPTCRPACFHTLVSAPLKWSNFCGNHCSSNGDPCLVSCASLNLLKME